MAPAGLSCARLSATCAISLRAIKKPLTYPPALSRTTKSCRAKKKFWADGLAASASEVAKKLGGFEHCDDGGRSAVLGKIHRLGLAPRAKTPPRPLSRKQKQALENGRTRLRSRKPETKKRAAKNNRRSEPRSDPKPDTPPQTLFVSSRKKREMGITDPEDGIGRRGSAFPKPDDDLPLEVLQYLERHLYT